MQSGTEARQVADDLLRTLRDTFLATVADGRVTVELPDDEVARLRDIGSSLGNSALVRALETLGQAIVDMRGVAAPDPRLVLEIAIVRLARRDTDPPLQALIDRVERLEQVLAGNAGGDSTDSPVVSPASEPRSRTSRVPRAALGGVEHAVPTAAEPPASSTSISPACSTWCSSRWPP